MQGLGSVCERTFRGGEELFAKNAEAVEPDDEADEVGGHHHKDIEDRANGADVAVPGLRVVLIMFLLAPFLR
jgi:hypothetical protein